ncbi:MAG: hypothetical protein QM765_34030 [Myxococcales bacterium]
MSNVKMDSIRRAAQTVKQHAEKADANHDGVLTSKEITAYGKAQKDEFVTGNALKTLASWAKASEGRATVANVQAKADEAVVAIEKRDKDGDGVIEDGKERKAADKLKTFQVLNKVAESQVATTDWPFAEGESYYDLRQRTESSTEKTRYTSPDQVTDPKLAKMMIEAAGVSCYDSTNLQEVFDQVDESEVVVRRIIEPNTGRTLLAVDYGAGDNTYGAIFDPDTAQMLVKIQDGDLYVTNAATIVEGETYNDLRERAATSEPKKRYTSPAEVTDPRLAQMMIKAACVSSYQSTTLQEVFDQVDQSEVVVRQLTDPRTHRQLLGIDYGAGDNTYGAVFDAITGNMVAEVRDGDLYVQPEVNA